MKRLTRYVLSLAAVALLASVAYVAQERENAGTRMAQAADKFLALLSPDERSVACFPFEDAERFNWHFIPLQDKNKNPTRKGLRLEKMNEEQKTAALAVLRAGLSRPGYDKATTIMSLESLLAELEMGGANVRNPGWYFVSVFGTPSRMGKWGFRVEGHHLSVNFTLDGGDIVSVTPAIFGSNPAVVMQGARQGTKPIHEVDQLAKDLIGALDDSQKKEALQAKQFPEIDARTKAPKVEKPVGLRMAQMNEKQRELLLKLLRSYAERMPAEVAERDMTSVTSSPPEQIYFAYAGELDQGKPHTYRIQGPKFLVEFLNIQADSAKNPANHIHSGWRTLGGDFGLAPK